MRMISKLLVISLLGSAMLWACGVNRQTDRAAEATGQLEDGPGSGSDPGAGSGSNPTDPPPEDTCSADGDIDQAQLDDAKRRLEKYLNGCTGQAAIDKVLKDFDKNKDGKLNNDELLALVKKIELNGGWFPKTVCGKVMKAIDSNGDGQLSQDELKAFLKKIGLDGPDQCTVSEDNPTVPEAL